MRKTAFSAFCLAVLASIAPARAVPVGTPAPYAGTPYVAHGGAAASSPANRAGHALNLIDDFGAKCDVVRLQDLTGSHVWVYATTGSTLVQFTGTSFTSADVGKYIVISGIGAGALPLASTITAVNSALSINLATTASTTASNVGVVVAYGHDDSAAFSAALAALPLGGRITVPRGNCGVASPIALPAITAGFSGYPDAAVTFEGDGRGVSQIVALASMNAVAQEPAGWHLQARWIGMTLDAMGVANYALDMAAGYEGAVEKSFFVNGLIADVRVGDVTNASQGVEMTHSRLLNDPTMFQGATFTGTISGTVLTVTSVANGALTIGQVISGAGVTPGTQISSMGPYTNGNWGTYNLSASSSVSTAETMTGAGAPFPADNLLVNGTDNHFASIDASGASAANFRDTNYGSNFYLQTHGFGPAQYAYWFNGNTTCDGCEVDGASVAGVRYDGGGNVWTGGRLFFLNQSQANINAFLIEGPTGGNKIIEPYIDNTLFNYQYVSVNGRGTTFGNTILISGVTPSLASAPGTLIATTTDATTPTILTTDGAAQTARNSIWLGLYAVLAVRGTLVVRDGSTGGGAVWDVASVWTSANGSAPVLVSSTFTQIGATAGFTLATPPVMVTTSTALVSFALTVQGVAGHTLHWSFVPMLAGAS